MKHSFDVVAIGIENEGTVVAGMVGPLTRSTVVSPSGSERCFVERVNGFAIGCLEGQVHAGEVSVSLIYEQFIRVEETGSLLQYLGQSDGIKHSTVEPLAGLQVRDAQVDVVKEFCPGGIAQCSPCCLTR